MLSRLITYLLDILWVLVGTWIIMHSPFTFDEKLIFTILYVGVTITTRIYLSTREIMSELFRLK